MTVLVLWGEVLGRLISFSSFHHILAKIFLQHCLRSMENRSYFKHIFKFALPWSPLKRIICSPFFHMEWETLHRQVTEECTSYLNWLSKLLLSRHPPLVTPTAATDVLLAGVGARCRHIGFLTPEWSWWLIHLPLQKCQRRETCGWVANSRSSCSSPGRHLHKPGGAPFPGAGRSPSDPAPNRLPGHEPWLSAVPAQELLPRLSGAARRGTRALTRLTRKPSFSTPASSSIIASREKSRAPAENCLSPGSLSLCTWFV